MKTERVKKINYSKVLRPNAKQSEMSATATLCSDVSILYNNTLQ